MQVTIQKKYLVFPVNTLSTVKKLTMTIDGEAVYQLDMKLDNVAPDFYAYIDVSRFAGQTLALSVEPQMQLQFREAEDMALPELYKEPMRPQIHFTTKNGWNNDPNGLLYLDGVYHMFYQHNPADPDWGNMHWGHAVSRDLIHWEETDIALFPDARGTMFSGSAILDTRNLLGKNDDGRTAAVLFYTTTQPFCQNLSYSVDGFQTIHPIACNPILPHIVASNRDPKVVYCQELDCYIMVLFLVDKTFALFASDNLTQWREVQRIELPGDAECPDIFPLVAKDGSRKWVFMGAHDKYLVGRFDGGKFVPEQPILSLHYGNSAYAGQTFSNLPGGRIVRMVWDTWHLPAPNFQGQMGIPMEFALEAVDGTYYLGASPVSELAGIYKNTQRLEHVAITPQQPHRLDLEDAPYRFDFRGSLYESGCLTLTVFGNTICLDFGKNELRLGTCTAPLSITRSGLELTVIADRCSLELFADGGKIFLSCLDKATFADRNLPYLTMQADTALALSSVEAISLRSIWEDQ